MNSRGPPRGHFQFLCSGAVKQIGSDCATLLRRCQPMMNKIPFADPSPDRDDHLGVPKPSEPLAITRNAAFQWPPDCLWPFIDGGSEGEA
jgi:hypothetical protein